MTYKNRTWWRNWRQRNAKPARQLVPATTVINNIIPPEIPIHEGPGPAFHVEETVPTEFDVWSRGSDTTKAHKVAVKVHDFRDLRPGKLIREDMLPVGSCVPGSRVNWVGKKIIAQPLFDGDGCANCTKLPKK